MTRRSKGILIGSFVALSAVVAALIIGLAWDSSLADHRKTAYREAPIQLATLEAPGSPSALVFFDGSLHVTYSNASHVDVFSPEGDRVRTIQLPDGAAPEGIAVTGRNIFTADRTGQVEIFSRDGEFVSFYRYLPGEGGEIKATAVAVNKDQLYVADAKLPGVLVISTVTFYGPVENGEPVPLAKEGELILTIPEKQFRPSQVTAEWDLLRPTYALVSPDGRVLVADEGLRMVKVYTCTGLYAYPFEKGNGKNVLSRPVAMAYDNLANREYAKEKKSVDPSGIRGHGRVHVVDKAKNRVFVYTTTGNFLFTYGQGVLSKPTSIAVDTKDRLIFIADSGHKRITIWGY